MWQITPLYFFRFKNNILSTKVAHQSENIQNGHWNSPNSSCHFWNKIQFFFKHCITLQCHEIFDFCTFSSETLYVLYKRSASKCKFSDFRLFEFFMSFFKPRVSSPLNFKSTFSVVTHNSYETFWLKHCMFWTNRVHLRLSKDFSDLWMFYKNFT